MEKGFWISLIIVVLIVIGVVFAVLTFNQSSCKIDEKESIPVSLELAKVVASDQVHRNNPPFEWISTGSLSGFDIDGIQKYYVFIFTKKGFNLNTLDKLEANAQLFLDSTSEEADKKYQFNDVATVIVGAVKEDKQIFRHYRGIPEFFAKRQEIKKYVEDNYGGKTVGDLVFTSQGSTTYYKIVNKGSETGDLISSFNNEIVSVSSLIDLKEKNEKRTLSRYSSGEDCDRYKKALEDAREAHITKWNSYL